MRVRWEFAERVGVAQAVRPVFLSVLEKVRWNSSTVIYVRFKLHDYKCPLELMQEKSKIPQIHSRIHCVVHLTHLHLIQAQSCQPPMFSSRLDLYLLCQAMHMARRCYDC